MPLPSIVTPVAPGKTLTRVHPWRRDDRDRFTDREDPVTGGIDSDYFARGNGYCSSKTAARLFASAGVGIVSVAGDKCARDRENGDRTQRDDCAQCGCGGTHGSSYQRIALHLG